MTNLLKNIFGTPFKHKKLSEDWANLQSSVGEGVTFVCRDLGSTVVTEAQNESATAEAIRRVIHLVRATRAKTNRVTLHVSAKGVKVRCSETGQMIRDTDISDIAYCSADSQYNHVIAFIANGERNAFDCYAYLCQSSKMAQTVALSIAHAFNMAYNETWQAECLETNEATEDAKINGIENNLIELEAINDCSENEKKSTIDRGTASGKFGLIDDCKSHSNDPWLLNTEEDKERMTSRRSKNSGLTNWTSFDDDSQIVIVNTLASLELGDDVNRSPSASTKPPQRCKAIASSDSFTFAPKLILNKPTKPKESFLNKAKTVETVTEVVGITSSQRSLSDIRPPTSELFCEFESLWKSKSGSFDWETFGSNSASFSLDLCQSPIAATKSSGTFQWTSFTD